MMKLLSYISSRVLGKFQQPLILIAIGCGHISPQIEEIQFNLIHDYCYFESTIQMDRFHL